MQRDCRGASPSTQRASTQRASTQRAPHSRLCGRGALWEVSMKPMSSTNAIHSPQLIRVFELSSLVRSIGAEVA
eukprot:3948856-Prymnesium_polylepis.2